MSETASTGETEATPTTESTEATVETPSTENNTKTPEWYEAELKKVRDEAAGHRVKGNEKAAAAKAAVTAEFEAKLAEANTAHEATKDELNLSTLTNAKFHTALEAVLGTETANKVKAFARTLQGATQDELNAHAKELGELFRLQAPARVPAVDPSQGLGASNKPNSGDQFTDFMVNMFDQKQ